MRNERLAPPNLTEARVLINDCRALGAASAPSTVAEGALVRVGLADFYTIIDTPLGPTYVAWNGFGLSLVSRPTSVAAFEEMALQTFDRPLYRVNCAPPKLQRAMEAWLTGDRRAPLDFDLRSVTPFVREALLKAREIPHGEVRPYSWVAREIGHPRAVRAVGTAMARNPIPLFIPCHRVVRADGHLGAYGLGGPESKRRMLNAEGLDVDASEALADAGMRYVGSDTTHVFCYPSCRHARRITDAHRVPFGSEGAARNAGYRPCHDCRPAEAQLAS